VNIQQLRQSLKDKWLTYYREHRSWVVKLGIWVDYDGARRPSSSYILATLMVLEPRLPRLMPLVVDLSSNPDRIVVALGLNFSPDDELARMDQETAGTVKLLPSSAAISATLPSLSVPSAAPIAAGSLVNAHSQQTDNGYGSHSHNGAVMTALPLRTSSPEQMHNDEVGRDEVGRDGVGHGEIGSGENENKNGGAIASAPSSSPVKGALPTDAPLFRTQSPSRPKPSRPMSRSESRPEGPTSGPLASRSSISSSPAPSSPEPSFPEPNSQVPVSTDSPPSTNPSRSASGTLPVQAKGAIAARDEQCMGRRLDNDSDNDEDIWR